ncbi:MAG: VWA domain-containing protein [Planctomycetales bacterium]|nr:VWA domain-containing protein [Planctomycetales bacterium]
MNGFRFESPLWLLAWLPTLLLLLLSYRRERGQAVLYSDTTLLADLHVTPRLLAKKLLPLVTFTGLTLLIIAAARPQMGEEEFVLHTEGIAIEMCLDRSGSMLAHDFFFEAHRVDRLTAVKDVFHKFVAGVGDFSGRPNDLIGLIAFGGFADARCPLTLDHGTLLEAVSQVEVAHQLRDDRGGILNDGLWQEEQATAIGDALALAVDRLQGIESASKIVILLSDGENTAGVVSPDEAAKVAADFDVKVYTIGVGKTGLAPFPMIDRFGRERLISQAVRLDETTLRHIASTTGGAYFHAEDATTLAEVYEAIDQLEKTDQEGRIYTQYRELYQFLMIPALGCLACVLVLKSTWLQAVP